MKYLNREISEYSLEDLQRFKVMMDAAIVRRDEASKHDKFKDMVFPTINPEFVKIKAEIEQAIESKNG